MLGAAIINLSDLPRRSNEVAADTATMNFRPADAAKAGLMRLVHSIGIPLRSALLAAHIRVLAAFSGQTDVVTGYVSNGRPEQLDGDRVLGLFLNTIPVRLSCAGGRWRDLALEAFRVERESFPFRRFPLAEIQRLQKRNPLFEVLFSFTNFHIYNPLEGKLQILHADGFEETNFPLVVTCSAATSGEDLKIRFVFDRSQISTRRAEALLRCWQTVLESMAQDPSLLYQDQCLLSESEKQLLLFEWNQTFVEYPRKSVIEFFE
ncbi:MAG: hypothetical protein DMG70_06540, partial [Acidobacteria bacterium]